MSKDFLSRTMVSNEAKTLPQAASMGGRLVHKETLTPWDATIYKGKDLTGSHKKLPPVPDEGAFTSHKSTVRITPTAFLAKGTGLGGTMSIDVATEAREKRVAGAGVAHSPPKAGALDKRPNPPNTELRKYYERSDLPVMLGTGGKEKLHWTADISRLDYHHFLPIFFSGLREVEEPFRFLAEAGVYDLLRYGGEAKVLPVIPQLILPLKDALNTRDPAVMTRTLKVIQALVSLGDSIGVTLVPYYRQLLPVLNIFITKIANLGDGIDYHQRFGDIGSIIQETLAKLEQRGGPDAYINIKYMVPTYESTIL